MPRPIGLFDSGVGGLTVFKALKDILPHVDIFYVADTAHVPYGVKGRDHVQRLSYRLAGYLIGQGVRIVVVACNSAIGSMLPEARDDFSTTILGPILPASLEAINVSRGKKIGVLGTTATILGGYYHHALKTLGFRAELICQEAPDLVTLVEKGRFKGEEVTQTVKRYLEPFQGQIDTLILGCTHFPLLLATIKEVLSDEISIIDPAIALAEEVASTLGERENIEKEGNYKFLSTDRSGLSPASLEWLREYLNLSTMEFFPLNL